jgi:hypothetical protein
MLKGCKHNIQIYVASNVASSGEKGWEDDMTMFVYYQMSIYQWIYQKITMVTHLAKKTNKWMLSLNLFDINSFWLLQP